MHIRPQTLIDTGATRTVLGEAAAAPLRLARVGTDRLTTAGGEVHVHGWIGLVRLSDKPDYASRDLGFRFVVSL